MTYQNCAASIWSHARRPRPDNSASQRATGENLPAQPEINTAGQRSIFQQDYDRLLFSTPVRRLSDKTQVWPMDDNDGVRTRLTHSHEVANLARSIGTQAFNGASEFFSTSSTHSLSLSDTIQPMLLAIGLGHDLGNPPFGHQGEAAIGRWFQQRAGWIFTHKIDGGDDLENPVSQPYRAEFTDFDGNPQTLRLLTRLQTHIDGVGLDLSAATLAAGLKYPVNFANRDKSRAPSKKGGYFQSEQSVVDWIRARTGLQEGQRHPLTWIMEACDDIAYSVLDVDDVLKKGMMSADDVLIILRRDHPQATIVQQLTQRFAAVETRSLAAEMQRDIKIQYLRAFLINHLINHASQSFISNAAAIFNFTQENALMDDNPICEKLKDVARLYAFDNPTVLRTEAMGATAIDGLMTALWDAISRRKDQNDLKSKRLDARSKYVFSLISPNYVNEAVNCNHTPVGALGLRYRELRLLTDMVSGMTDTFAMRLWKNVNSISDVHST